MKGGNYKVSSQLGQLVYYPRPMARSETSDLMCAHADQLGANAIIAVRYDATELMAGLTEVLCYGTAVVVTTI